MFATVVASMRNEGPFIVEWVTWYRMLGFRRIVVVTNDCADRSCALLDALEDARWVQHLRVEVPAGKSITGVKLAAARATRAVSRADWVMVCDADEFLVIHKGCGKLADLLPEDAPFLGMSINWRVFGTDGHVRFEDGLVHRQFLGAVARTRALSGWLKSIHRHSGWFKALGEHGPVGLQLDRTKPAWGDEAMVWVDSASRPLDRWHPDAPYLRVMNAADATHEVAQINHYMLRSAETFGLKAGTLSPVARKDRYTEDYWKRANRADQFETSALRYADEFDALHAAAMALPGVRRLHYLCCADHVRLICEKAGREVQDDPRYAEYLAQAASAG